LLGTTPSRSSHESPFLYCLQPSWKHQTFAHLPVYAPTPHPQLKHWHSEDHKVRESVLRTSMPLLPNSAPVGKPTSSCKPSSTINSSRFHCCLAQLSKSSPEQTITYILFSSVPTQIPLADPVRVLSDFCCVTNELFNLLFCLHNCLPMLRVGKPIL
ncbi:hypothetical protein GOODEAATRI_010121, partial [Goodea atripinnis]